MKAIKISNYGDANVLKLSDAEPDPKPGDGQVLVEIHAAGVNFVDIYQRKGIYPHDLPYIPGLEAAGVVQQVGKGVKGFRPGTAWPIQGRSAATASSWRLMLES